MKKMISCRICNAEIAANAKVCPQCGAKNRKPIYQKWWFYLLLIVLFIIIIASAASGGNENAESESKTSSKETSKVESQIEYETVDVGDLIDELENNAMKAEKKYNQKYVLLTGVLTNIDSDGKYISLEPTNTEFSFTNVMCYLKNREQKDFIMNLSKGDVVTLKGKIKRVGEVLGYSIDVIEFQ